MFTTLLLNEWQAQARLRRGALMVLVSWYILAFVLSHSVWGDDAPLTANLMLSQPFLWLPFYGLALGLQSIADKRASGSFGFWLSLPVSPTLALGAKLVAFFSQVLLATSISVIGSLALNWFIGARLLSIDPLNLLLSLLTYWLTCLLVYQGALAFALIGQVRQPRGALLPLLVGAVVSAGLLRSFWIERDLSKFLCTEAMGKPLCFGLAPASPLLTALAAVLLLGWFAVSAWLVGRRVEV